MTQTLCRKRPDDNSGHIVKASHHSSRIMPLTEDRAYGLPEESRFYVVDRVPGLAERYSYRFYFTLVITSAKTDILATSENRKRHYVTVAEFTICPQNIVQYSAPLKSADRSWWGATVAPAHRPRLSCTFHRNEAFCALVIKW